MPDPAFAELPADRSDAAANEPGARADAGRSPAWGSGSGHREALAADPSDRALISDWALDDRPLPNAARRVRLPLAAAGLSTPQVDVDPVFEAPPV